ncbi:beta-1,3-galactosyltransferase 6-like [Ornithodoros turicata]|uniref:beta-1,3-galactosyltransferase 6-like n=1 Tax=Ornithodoros turicata TaxID=34597 RepID=UPI00313862C0
MGWENRLQRTLHRKKLVPTFLAFVFGILIGWGFRSLSESWIGSDNDKEETFLFVAIVSSPNASSSRHVIRNTWVRLRSQPTVSYKFFVGTYGLSPPHAESLAHERETHGDLVTLEHFEDSYDRLSLKLLEIFKWTAGNVRFAYMLKVDDDSLARVDVIADELLQRPKTSLYWGFFSGNARVFREGKWADKTWFLCDRYLPYARGGGYVLSADIVHYVATNANLLQAYKSEDVSVGVWLSPLKLTRQHDPRFDTEYKSRGCFNTYLVTHKQTEHMIQQKFNSLQRNGLLCPMEVRTRYSYVYNWDVRPSQCCIRNDTKVP